jgi:hypothetical protein
VPTSIQAQSIGGSNLNFPSQDRFGDERDELPQIPFPWLVFSGIYELVWARMNSGKELEVGASHFTNHQKGF